MVDLRGILKTVEHLPNGSQREQWMKSLFHFASQDRKRPNGQLMSSIPFSVVSSGQKNKVFLCIGLLSVCKVITFGDSGGVGGSGDGGGLAGSGGESDDDFIVKVSLYKFEHYDYNYDC